MIREAIEGSVKDTRPEPAPKQKETKPEEGIEFPFKTPLDELKYRADQAGISLDEIQKACVKTNLQPDTKFIEEYEQEFIKEALLDKWEGFTKFVLKNRGKK